MERSRNIIDIKAKKPSDTRKQLLIEILQEDTIDADKVEQITWNELISKRNETADEDLDKKKKLFAILSIKLQQINLKKSKIEYRKPLITIVLEVSKILDYQSTKQTTRENMKAQIIFGKILERLSKVFHDAFKKSTIFEQGIEIGMSFPIFTNLQDLEKINAMAQTTDQRIQIMLAIHKWGFPRIVIDQGKIILEQSNSFDEIYKLLITIRDEINEIYKSDLKELFEMALQKAKDLATTNEQQIALQNINI